MHPIFFKDSKFAIIAPQAKTTLMDGTVDGSEILNNHLGYVKPQIMADKLPTSTGERQISEPSTVCDLTLSTRLPASGRHG